MHDSAGITNGDCIMKKFTAILVCALLVMCMLPANVFAEDVYDVDEYDNYATWLDWFYWNGEQLTDKSGREKADEFMDNRDMYNVDTRESIGYIGWACFYEPIESFGYILNDEIVLSEDFFFGNDSNLSSTVESWWPGTGELAKRYVVTVPIKDLYGTNEIVVCAKLENGDIVKLNSELDVARDTTVIFEFDPDPNATEAPTPTEAPTDVPTEPAAEDPTEEAPVDPTAGSEEPTEVPVDTAPTDKPDGDNSGSDSAAKNKGCGGFVSGAAVLLAAAAAGYVLVKRKEK